VQSKPPIQLRSLVSQLSQSDNELQASDVNVAGFEAEDQHHESRQSLREESIEVSQEATGSIGRVSFWDYLRN
jgi:hypothetical protein